MTLVQSIIKYIFYFFFISFVSFGIIRLIPGDPVQNIIGERGASEERVAEIKKNLGLDQSAFVQYYLFTTNILKGNFGESIVSKQPVMSEFKVLWPATLELTFAALMWSSIVGVLLGVIAAVKKNTWLDYGIVSLSTIGFAMPLFWWALMIIFYFAVHLGLFPVSGRIDVMYDVPFVTGLFSLDTLLSHQVDAFFSSLKHLVLPAFVLGTIPLALFVRVTRASMIDISFQDYIRTARAKGLSSQQIIFKHVFKNALPQIITSFGLSLGHLLTGAIMTETIFSWPGIGRWIVKSIEARDYPVVQAGIFYSMLTLIVVFAITDFCIKQVNPRLREVK